MIRSEVDLNINITPLYSNAPVTELKSFCTSEQHDSISLLVLDSNSYICKCKGNSKKCDLNINMTLCNETYSFFFCLGFCEVFDLP